MSAINISTAKTALRNWVIAGSGLAADHVIWTLGAKRPSGTYIHLRLKVALVGQDWVHVSPTDSPTSGNDATYTVVGSRKLTLTMTCFAPAEPNQGARAPEQILDDVLTAWSLPSVGASLAAAKLGWLTNTDIVPIDLNIDSTLFEPRATVSITMHVIAQLAETGPAIDTVDGIVGEADVNGNTITSTFTVDGS